MKRKISLLTIIFLLSLSVSSSAHPGRTDQNGGHWDRETGEYHFHTGEYAGRSSSGSTSTATYEPFTPPYTPPATNPYRENKKIDTSDVSEQEEHPVLEAVVFLVLLYIIGVSFFTFLRALCHIIYDDKLKKNLPKHYINLFAEKLNDLNLCEKKLCEYEKELIEFNKTDVIPDQYEIGTDDLPKEKNVNGWGQTFTVYKSRKGYAIHAKLGCCGAKIPKHIFYIIKSKGLLCFCKKCCKSYEIPDYSWYDKYLHDKKIKSEYKLQLLNFAGLYSESCKLYKKCNSTPFRFILFFCRKNRKELENLNINLYKIQSKNETKVRKNKDNVSNNARAYIVHFSCLCSNCGKNIKAKYRLKQNSSSTPKVFVNCPQCQARTTVQIRLPFDYTYNVEKTTK